MNSNVDTTQGTTGNDGCSSTAAIDIDGALAKGHRANLEGKNN